MYNAFMRPCKQNGSTAPSSCRGDDWILFQTRVAFTAIRLAQAPAPETIVEIVQATHNAKPTTHPSQRKLQSRP
jgi:hypothetical protein